jgi:DNA-binding CsgD family transcriptional regulator
MKKQTASGTNGNRKRHERLTELLDESFALHRSEPRRAIELALEARDLADDLHDVASLAKAHYRVGCAKRELSEYNEALEHLDLSIAACKKASDKRQLSGALHIKGSVLSFIGSHQEAKPILLESAAIRRELGLKTQTSDTLTDLASVLFRLGDYAGALAALYECLQLLEGQDEPLRLSIILSVIASIYLEANFDEKAEEYILRGLELVQSMNDSSQEAALRLMLYALRSKHMSNTESVIELEAIERLIGDEGSPDLLIEVRMHLAECHLAEAKFDIAQTLAEESAASSERLGLKTKNVEASILLGDILQRSGKTPNRVEEHYLTALDLAIAIGCLVQGADAAAKLAMHYRSCGRTEQALEYLFKERELLAKFNIEKQQRAVPQLQARIELERAERERERLSLEKASLEQERERSHVQLATLALHLVHKNEFLAEIRESVAQTSEGEDIVRRINEHVRSDKDWQQFEEQMNAMQGDFLSTLSRKYPELTMTERKVAALMRLNLSSKAVANLLCLSVRTVENHRLSIRKKVGLNNDVNLTTFLSGL